MLPLKYLLAGVKPYRTSLAITAIVSAGLFVAMGAEALVRFLMLSVLEVDFSFDNAVVNATVLATMALAWQKRFLTWGMAIAVFGMRFAFPLGVVSVTARLSPLEVMKLAIWQPHDYAKKLDAAHPEILILSGVFLLLIFLDFIFEERRVTWLGGLERGLAKAGKLDMVSIIITGITIIVVSELQHSTEILLYGFASMIAYATVNSLSSLFDADSDDDVATAEARPTGVGTKTGMAAFAAFGYLETQDGSFSFDSVSGAFAVTDKIFLIVLGLGVGALFVRSMTLHLLRSGLLDERSDNNLVYLEHGAHWAIGVLAVLMLVAQFVDIPNYVPGLSGVVIIAASVVSSIRYNKRRLQGSLDITGAPPDVLNGGCDK